LNSYDFTSHLEFGPLHLSSSFRTGGITRPVLTATERDSVSAWPRTLAVESSIQFAGDVAIEMSGEYLDWVDAIVIFESIVRHFAVNTLFDSCKGSVRNEVKRARSRF